MSDEISLTAPVTADTISDITGRFAPPRGNAPDLRLSVSALINRLADSGEHRSAHTVETLLKNPPPGVSLALAYAARDKRADLSLVNAEYRRILPLLRRHRAAVAERELKTLGLCDHGLKRLRDGRPPTTVDAYPYRIDVDHVIECGAAGPLAVHKGSNHFFGPNQDPAFWVNHPYNLFMVPRRVHELKNWLIGLQPKRQGWIVTLAPTHATDRNPLVCAAQPDGLELEPITPHIALKRLSFCANKIGGLSSAFMGAAKKNDSSFSQTRQDLRDALCDMKKMVKVILQDTQKDSPLRQAFVATWQGCAAKLPSEGSAAPLLWAQVKYTRLDETLEKAATVCGNASLRLVA